MSWHCDGPLQDDTGAWICPFNIGEPEDNETWDEFCGRCKAKYDLYVDQQMELRREQEQEEKRDTWG